MLDNGANLSTSFVFAAELDEPVIEDDVTEYVDANGANTYLNKSDTKAVCNTTVTTKKPLPCADKIKL